MPESPYDGSLTRRDALVAVGGLTAAALGACKPGEREAQATPTPLDAPGAAPMVTDPDAVVATRPLGFVWETADPFLFCVHHDDAYPAGDERMAPAASLAGRRLGNDFEPKDGWRMYHGRVVPGFPQHPHRGFETVTLARRGFIDHSDSLGATARFGRGDVQWMTAGRGISHAEMFPLIDRDGPNPVELFQIWLNLPGVDKMTEPRFAMLWDHTIPRVASVDAAGRRTEVTVMAGHLGDAKAPSPPPASWAARADSDVAIWLITMEAGAEWVLPPAGAGTDRTLYVFEGERARVGHREVQVRHGATLRRGVAAVITAGPTPTELLLLQGRPIGEPVAQHGPFVMSSRDELQQAFNDYRAGGFGRWPWPDDAPVHSREAGRFARHADGRVEHA